MKRVAVVGSGIAGLATAHALAGQAQVTLFEADRRFGGHSHTVDVTLDGITHGVDTGFLVFNHRTYPNLVRLFDALGVETAPSDMSFSVQVPSSGLEWSGSNLNSVFAQRRNLVSPRFLGMLREVLRFNRLATALAGRWPYKVESWQDTNAGLVSALNAQSVSTTLIRSVVMVVVVLGIASVLVVSVVQKRREIGILRAMGATQGQVLRVFLLQGAIVGAIGSVLGVLLAQLLILAFTSFVRGSDGLPLFAITLSPLLALQIAAIATVCGVLAAVAPARRAARLDPALAIRM